MIQRRGGLRIALEAFFRLRACGQMRRQEFERDCPAEPRIVGLINHAHATSAEISFHSIAPDPCPLQIQRARSSTEVSLYFVCSVLMLDQQSVKLVERSDRLARPFVRLKERDHLPANRRIANGGEAISALLRLCLDEFVEETPDLLGLLGCA